MGVRGSVFRRHRLLWLVLAALAASTGVVVAIVTNLEASPRGHMCGCKLPPVTTGIAGVPHDWQTALAHRDVQAAWRLLTPEAQRRYASPKGLRTALAGLAPDPHGRAEWRMIDERSQGRDTPSDFFYILIEKRTLRPAGAIVVHTMATGAADGRVDPTPTATVHILEPAAHTTLGRRPRMRAATSSPPEYVAVRAGGQTVGAAGAIRGTDSRDDPFDEALQPGPTLIVAVESDTAKHFTYGSVRVTIR
jgi:hypothetical protein